MYPNQVSSPSSSSLKSTNKNIQLIPVDLNSQSFNSSLPINLQLNDSISLSHLDLHFKNHQGQILMIAGSSPVMISKDSFYLVKDTEYKIETISFTVKFTLKKLKIITNQGSNSISLELDSSENIYYNVDQRQLLICKPGQDYDFEIIKDKGWIIKENINKDIRLSVFKAIKAPLAESCFYPVIVNSNNRIQVENSKFLIKIQDMA